MTPKIIYLKSSRGAECLIENKFLGDYMQEGSSYHILEERVSAKIWYLIELALKSGYSRAGGDKSTLNSKFFIDSREAKYFKDKETINENLDLK